ncbi:unnamed protein product, partial [Candidula unifasciata]
SAESAATQLSVPVIVGTCLSVAFMLFLLCFLCTRKRIEPRKEIVHEHSVSSTQLSDSTYQ